MRNVYQFLVKFLPQALVPSDMNAVNKKAVSSKIKEFYFSTGVGVNNTNAIKVIKLHTAIEINI